MTGKRHDFRADWRVGFDDEGRISGYDVALRRALRLFGRPVARRRATARCSTPTTPICCRRSRSARAGCKTNTVSNTAFRGFGGPQGMLAHRARDGCHRLRDRPRSARRAQGQSLRRRARDRTPYGMKVEDTDTLPALIEDARAHVATIARRREEIAAFNATSADPEAAASR